MPENAIPTAEATQPGLEAATIEKPKEEVVDSSRFAALSKREKSLLRRAREITTKEKMLEQELARFRPYQEIEALKGKNKLEAIKRLGISYEDLTNEYLSGGQPNSEQQALSRAEELVQEKMSEFEKRHQETINKAQQDQYNSALKQIRANAESVAAQESDTYALVKQHGAYDTVTALIEEKYKAEGVVLPIEEAMKMVEQDLHDRTFETLKSLLKVEKFRSKILELASPQEAPPQETKPVASPLAAALSKQPTTITHKQMTSSPTPRGLTPQELRQRAIDIYYGRAAK